MIRIEVNIDDKKLTKALEGLAELGRDATPVMRGLAGIMGETTETAFSMQRDPVTGAAWPDLHPEYKKQRYARGYTGKMLHVKGTLATGIQQEWGRDYARVGTNVIYAAAHQFGARTRPHVLRASRGKALLIPGMGFRRKVNHPGSNIPARPFLGIGPEDRENMRKLILTRLNELIAG